LTAPEDSSGFDGAFADQFALIQVEALAARRTMMNVETLFHLALEKPPGERAALLDETCQADADLRGQVERLIAEHDRQESFILDTPVAGIDATVDHPISERPGTVIGPYKLLQQIGEGGMGVVFMAEQTEPIQRTVALKIIKPGMDTRQVIARFEAERQAVAMMDHPNIAKVLDAGTTDTGRPYFVMELVKGVPITRYCDEKHLPLRARLELFVEVCQAVQHAHQKGIIHRDIKPTNVLVAEYDHHATPKVIDFGVAKATAQKLTERTMFTEFGQVLGTLEYMSPEQSKFNQLDIDTRSDIYSLGVLLYELLAGSTPFEGKRLHAAAFDEMLRIIREEEPPKPSTRLSSIDTLPSVAANRHTEPARLSKDVRGELDWIVMKALEKDRNRRYETASGFAADIERHLHDEPVEAGPPSATYRFRKFARRNKGPVAAIAGIVLSLALGLLLTTIGFMQASRERAVARSNESNARNEAVKATAISDLLREMLDSANPDIAARGSDYTVRQMLDAFSAHLGDQLKDQPEAEAAIRASIGNAYWRIGLNPDAEPHLKRALALRRQVLSADDPDLTQSLVDYAMNVCDLGDGVAAESLANEALAVYRRRGAKGVEVLRAFFALQLAFQRQQSWAKERSAGEEALAFARDAGHKEHPDLANILHSLAKAMSKGGDHAEGEAIARSAVAMHRRTHGNEHPETGWGLNLLGEILAAQGKHAEAEPQFREALTILRRSYPHGHHTVSGVEEALRETLRAKGDASAIEALATLKLAEADKRLAMNREDPEIWLARARVYLEMNRYDKAALDADTAVTLSASLSTESALGLANFCSQLAGRQRDNKQPQQAEHVFRQAISVRESLGGKASPELQLAQANDYNDLAFVLVGATRLPEAERAIRTALELKQALVNDFPDNRDYRIHLAHSYLGLGHIANDSGRTSDAVQAYGEAASILNKLVAEPSGTQQFERWLSDTLSQLGDAWLRVNRPDDAKQAHQKALGRISMLAAEFPDNPDYQLELARFLHDAGDLDGALAQFSNILDKHPNRADAWTGRAWAYLHLQQWDSAVADYSEAIELAPEVHTNWYHRGHLYLQLAQWDKAAADFTKVIEGWPDEPGGWYLRALAYAQLNQPEKAIADLRQAIAKGLKDAEQLKNEPKLEPLRANEEFKKLLAAMEAEQK